MPGTLFATAGIHPHHASELDAHSIAALRKLLENPAVVAVGECGLGYHRNYSPRDAQLAAEILGRQIQGFEGESKHVLDNHQLAVRGDDDPIGGQGPVGHTIARLIAEGYKDRYEAFHGYYFKILKGQGPSAPMGQMDFLVGGAMIGGFALVAAPAEYMVTGVKTFIVSHNGIVYEKDLGEKTFEQFRTMERYDPDSTWRPVTDN